MNERVCTRCWKNIAIPKKTFCKECDSKRFIEYRKTRGKYNGVCSHCGKKVVELKNELGYCTYCFSHRVLVTNNQSQYQSSKGAGNDKLHTRIAEILIGVDLGREINVHHIDENKENNHPYNLMILERSVHSQVHMFLKRYKIRYKGDKPWDEVRLEMSIKFFEMYGLRYTWLKNLFDTASDEKKEFIKKLLEVKVLKGQPGIHENFTK